MKKLLCKIFAGALVCFGLISCDKDENESSNVLRFPPVASKADRLVRMDISTPNTLGRVETGSYLFKYNEKGQIIEINAVNKSRNTLSYPANGVKFVHSWFDTYGIYNGIYPKDYLIGAWSEPNEYSFIYDGKGNITETSGGKSSTITLNEDGTASYLLGGKFEWKDGNLIRITGDEEDPVSEFEYSDKLNPWCGIDVYNIVLELLEDDAVLGLFMSKNIPTKYISKDKDKTKTYTIESELDDNGRPKMITVRLDGKMTSIAELFYGSYDESSVHSFCEYTNFVTKQEILEKKFVAGTELNYSFSYKYKVHTFFSDGTDKTEWFECPNEVVNVSCSRTPEAETYTFPTPQFTGMDAMEAGSEELNKKLGLIDATPRTKETRRLRFKLDTSSDYVDITISFVYDHGIVYWDGNDRILHHPYVNPTIRLSDEGFQATGPSTSSRHGHSCELMNYKGKMLLDLNGLPGKDCFPFEVEINMYKLTN